MAGAGDYLADSAIFTSVGQPTRCRVLQGNGCWVLLSAVFPAQCIDALLEDPGRLITQPQRLAFWCRAIERRPL